MPTIRKILVPVDFSETSREAVRYGTDLARRFGAAITVVHAYSVPGYVLPEGFLVAGPETVAQLTFDLERSLSEVRDEVRRSGVAEVDMQLIQGSAASEIVRLADQGGYDLIIMGTHGHTGLRHALLGSVAEKVVRKASCPVLTVRVGEAARDAHEHPSTPG